MNAARPQVPFSAAFLKVYLQTAFSQRGSSLSRLSHPGLLAGALAFILCLVAGHFYYKDSFAEVDTVSYLFEAKLIAQGRIAAMAPPDWAFSPSPHINIYEGRWFSKYPPGNALILALGVLLGWPTLIPAFLTGGAVFLVYLIVEKLSGQRVATVATALATISPSTIILGGTWFSEVTDRFALGLSLFGCAIGNPWLAGAALGYSWNTRPLTALAFVPALAAVLWVQANLKKDFAGKSFAAFLPFLLLSFAWNACLTGNPVEMTHTLQQPYDGLGFGPRGPGNVVDVSKLGEYTLQEAANRTVLRTSRLISYTSLGWPLGLPFLSVAAALVAGPRKTGAVFVLALGMPILAYAFHYFQLTNPTPISARYYAEAILFGLIPLIAHGCVILWDRMPRRVGQLGAALLMLSTVLAYWNMATPTVARGEYIREMEDAVETRDIHNAVIFARSWATPLGDYPFKPLKDADVVFYRLGPQPEWHLTETDWQSVYRRYFDGRQAYLYADGKLEKLR